MSALGTSGKLENISARRELIDAVKTLLNDQAFGFVYYQLYDQWTEQLMGLSGDGPIQAELCARLRALTAIPQRLANLLDNHKAELRKAARNG